MTHLQFGWEAGETRFSARGAAAHPETPPVVFADVRLQGDTLVILHTETHPEHQGEGLADRLTRELLDQARAKGWRVDPRCPYTAKWLERHPEYADLRVD